MFQTTNQLHNWSTIFSHSFLDVTQTYSTPQQQMETDHTKACITSTPKSRYSKSETNTGFKFASGNLPVC